MKPIFFFIFSLLICSVSLAGGSSTLPIQTGVSQPSKNSVKNIKKATKSKKQMGEKRRIVALLLCLFLGWLALHRWYLGTSDRPKLFFTLLYFLLSLLLYIHIILDFISILIGKMDFYLDNPGIFIWVMALL